MLDNPFAGKKQNRHARAEAREACRSAERVVLRNKAIFQHLWLFDALIEKQRIREVSLLVMESQALPTQTELLTRY